MNIFDQYGIKEVADVTIFSIHKKEDGSGDVYYVPALYLDTLKVTSTEKTAEDSWAVGGLGNSLLVGWDYDKRINLTLEDALCTPASLGLCWGGILSADWHDNEVELETGVKDFGPETQKISRIEKAFYPRSDGDKATVDSLLPRADDDIMEINNEITYLPKSSVLDGVDVKGFGYVNGKPYKWRLEIDSSIKSVAVIPDRFFDIRGNSYSIKYRQTVGVTQPSDFFKYEVIYIRGTEDFYPITKGKIIYHRQHQEETETLRICTDEHRALQLLKDDEYKYFKVRVCSNNSIKAFIGKTSVDWDLTREIEDDHALADIEWVEIPFIDTRQFRGIKLWNSFKSINALSYYIMTKYEDNIYRISPKIIKDGLTNLPNTFNQYNVEDVVGLDYELQDSQKQKLENYNSIWAYVNPRTMTPYDDDYWFSQGEPYYKKSITFNTKELPLNAQQITVTAGTFPGMYKIVGETYIRDRVTGKDKRMQITFPLCKIKSNQTLSLQSDSEPTTFNLDVEAATNKRGVLMEMVFYEVEQNLKKHKGKKTSVDGSTKISAK